MWVSETGRQQIFDPVPKQFITGESEEIFCLRIDENNSSSFIDYHHCIWCGFEEVPEWLESS